MEEEDIPAYYVSAIHETYYQPPPPPPPPAALSRSILVPPPFIGFPSSNLSPPTKSNNQFQRFEVEDFEDTMTDDIVTLRIDDVMTIEIEKFDGTDYGFWRSRIEDYLYVKDLHQPLEGKKPEKMEEADWVLLDRKVLGLIRLTLSKSVVHNVAMETTTAGMMKVLSDIYENPSAINKVFLMKKLFHLKMGEGADVATHVNEFNKIVNQLSSIKIEFDDEVRALILLATLPSSWESMRVTVINSVGNEKLKFTDVRNHILAEDVRRRDFEETSSSSTLNVNNRGENKDGSYNRNKSRSKSSNGIGNSKSKQSECWNCGEIGHMKKDCPLAPDCFLL